MTASGDTLSPSRRCHVCGTRDGAGQTNCPSCGTAWSKRHDPGTVLGSYRLDEVIGEGGMGIVYSATHTRLGRRVAIKMLRSHYTNNPQAVHRFFAEARAVNKIDHPNIIDITDFIEQSGADNYYVMELLQGTNLATLIEQAGILPLSRTTAIMMQVASVMQAVHRAGIVHRDIKPDNVFLAERAGQNDFVKLVDFGVAKLIDDNDTFVAMHNTNPGAILGTPQYMSPEQASALPVDHRADIYAFGVMLYKLVTGRLPHAGDNFGEIVVEKLTADPTPPRSIPDLPHEVPESLQELVLACLAKTTVDRPDSMETVFESLDEIANEQGWIVYELNLKSSGRIETRAATTGSGPRLDTPPPTPAPTPAPKPKPTPELAAAPAKVKQPSVNLVEWPSPDRRPARRAWPIAIGVACVAIALVAVVAMRGRDSGSKPAADIPAKVQVQLDLADERIAAGRLVAPGGDDALEHLLAARQLDPSHAAVLDRLATVAKTYEALADQAIAADSLAEAAAHLQVVLTAQPDNVTAAKKMQDVEAKILERQRSKPR